LVTTRNLAEGKRREKRDFEHGRNLGGSGKKLLGSDKKKGGQFRFNNRNDGKA